MATYLDILIPRRTWNFKPIDYSTMQYDMFLVVILSIRGASRPELARCSRERSRPKRRPSPPTIASAFTARTAGRFIGCWRA